MSRSTRQILLLAVLALLATRAQAWQWKSAAVDRDSLTLGDPLTLTLCVTAEAGEQVVWPLPGAAQLGGWRLLGADSLLDEPGEGGRLITRRLRLARFKLGDAPLPTPGPLRGGLPAAGDTLRLAIRPALPDSASALAEILAPARIAHGWAWWLLRLGGAALLLAAVWLGVRAWLRKAGAVPPPRVHALDPWQAFLEEMGRVEALGLWRAGQVESHYAALSLALRGLLEDSLGLPCRELTTEELRGALRDTPLSDGDLAELFRLLEENDWVKYARRWPDAETCARQIERYQKWALLRKEALLARHRELRAAGETA
jgi:hypothetical protein